MFESLRRLRSRRLPSAVFISAQPSLRARCLNGATIASFGALVAAVGAPPRIAFAQGSGSSNTAEASAVFERPHEDVVRDLVMAQNAQARESLPQALSEPEKSARSARRSQLVAASDLFAGLQGTDFRDDSLRTESINETNATKRVTLRNFDTRVKNQAERGWCTSFATVAVLENLAFRRSGRALNLSEIHHWSHYQQFEMFASVDAAKRSSIALETAWPYRSERPSGIDSRGIVSVTGSRELTTRSQVFASIDAGKPVVMGTMVTPSWESAITGSVNTSGQELGGHAIALVGYARDSRIAGGGYFVIKNSWGPSWGDQGYGYIPFAQCERHWCAFIAVDSVKVSGDSRT